MSEAPATPATPGPVPVPAPQPAAPLTALQILGEQLQGFIKQHEQAVANVHAIEGAIQATQHLIQRLRAEEAKAAAAVVNAATEVVTEVKEGVENLETELSKAVGGSVKVLGVVEKK